MPDVIQFQEAVLTDPGAVEMDIVTITIHRKDPKLVKVVLLQTDADGNFVENGKTINVRQEGATAEAILSSPTYAGIINSVRAALVAGSSLPVPGTVVQK